MKFLDNLVPVTIILGASMVWFAAGVVFGHGLESKRESDSIYAVSAGTSSPPADARCGMQVGPDRWIWFAPEKDGMCRNPLMERK